MPYTPHTWVSGEQITAAKLNAIETALGVAAGAVTASWEVTSTAAFTTLSGSYVDVTGLSVSVTTTGGDLLVWLVGGGFGQQSGGGGFPIAGVNVNGTDYTISHARVTSGTTIGTGSLAGFVKITGLAAGTYTVKARLKSNGGVSNADVNYGANSRTSLFALELKR